MEHVMIRITAAMVAVFLAFAARGALAQATPLECTNFSQAHPEWIWCDDFEVDSSLEKNYFEVGRGSNRFGVTNSTAHGGSGSLKASYVAGEQSAGGLKLSIGRNPADYNGIGLMKDRDFTEIYWRFYMKTSTNWVGNAEKLTRAVVFADSSWSEAALGHLWDDSPDSRGLALDPASGVQGSTVMTHGYNDFDHMTWLGLRAGKVQVYAAENRDKWFCIEAHMKLNSPGQSNGEFAFWIDDALQAETKTLNWRGSYTAYGINTVMLENFVTDGSPGTQERYLDSLVVSTARVGCQAAPATRKPSPPTSVHTS
jgi:hypothetical protein